MEFNEGWLTFKWRPEIVDTHMRIKNNFFFRFLQLYRINFERREGRTIFLSRHGESEYNVDARIGGNPPLTPKGQRYAKALGTYMNSLSKKCYTTIIKNGYFFHSNLYF